MHQRETRSWIVSENPPRDVAAIQNASLININLRERERSESGTRGQRLSQPTTKVFCFSHSAPRDASHASLRSISVSDLHACSRRLRPVPMSPLRRHRQAFAQRKLPLAIAHAGTRVYRNSFTNRSLNFPARFIHPIFTSDRRAECTRAPREKKDSKNVPRVFLTVASFRAALRRRQAELVHDLLQVAPHHLPVLARVRAQQV